jgi:peptide/nickel transport system ATP-binding protein
MSGLRPGALHDAHVRRTGRTSYGAGRRLGVAYLFITHNFGVVEYLAHDIAVMQAGRIVEAGPAEQILEAPRHLYTQTLLAAVPRLALAA